MQIKEPDMVQSILDDNESSIQGENPALRSGLKLAPKQKCVLGQ